VTASAGRPAQSLTLAERLLLLSFRPDTGKQKARAGSGTGSMSRAVQTALVVELIELGHLRVVSRGAVDPSRMSLQSTSNEPTGNVPLDAMQLAIGEEANARRTVGDWVSSGVTGDLVAEDLARRGIAAERFTTWGPFRRNYRLDVLDEDVLAEARDHFQAVFYGGHEATPGDCLFAALRADGFLWEYYAPLRNHESQMRFLGTVNELADRGRPSFSERDRSTDGGIATVLVALAHTNSGSAT
jgi:hypothetical protein